MRTSMPGSSGSAPSPIGRTPEAKRSARLLLRLLHHELAVDCGRLRLRWPNGLRASLHRLLCRRPDRLLGGDARFLHFARPVVWESEPTPSVRAWEPGLRPLEAHLPSSELGWSPSELGLRPWAKLPLGHSAAGRGNLRGPQTLDPSRAHPHRQHRRRR